MKTVDKHNVKSNHEWYEYCQKITTTSGCLYNSCQYTQRQGYFYGHGIQSQASLDKLFKENEHYLAMPAKVSQLVLKQNTLAWQSYFKCLKEYKKSKSQFTGQPKPPKYVDEFNLVKFNYQAVGKGEFQKGWIVPSMSPIRIPVQPGMKFENLCEVRIVPKTGCFVIEVVYETAASEAATLKPNLAAAIDIGLDNLATVVFNDISIAPIIVNGKPLKSVNKFYNKQIAKYKGFLPQGVYSSHRLKNITRNRNNFVDSYIHQSSKMLVAQLVNIGVTEVAIGKNEQWKQSINLGQRTNQSFVQVPHARFVKILTYKLQQVGIQVVVGEESYTSRASFLDWDKIPTYTPNTKIKHQFSGKRIHRSWYIAKNGTRIHADVNGAYNIGRKVIPMAFNVLRHMGCQVVHPRRITPVFRRAHAEARVA